MICALSLSLSLSIWTIAREISLFEEQTREGRVPSSGRSTPLLMDDESELSGEGRESKKGGRPDSNFPLSSFFLSPKRRTEGPSESREVCPILSLFRSSLTRQSSDDLLFFSAAAQSFPSSCSPRIVLYPILNLPPFQSQLFHRCRRRRTTTA